MLRLIRHDLSLQRFESVVYACMCGMHTCVHMHMNSCASGKQLGILVGRILNQSEMALSQVPGGLWVYPFVFLKSWLPLVFNKEDEACPVCLRGLVGRTRWSNVCKW